MSENPVMKEEMPHNGACFGWIPSLRKYAVLNYADEHHGYRLTADAAREHAASLPAKPREEPSPTPVPAPVSRSPSALPVPEPKPAPYAVPRDERPNLYETIRAQEPRRLTAYEKSLASSRQQHAAFMRVYGRHMGRR